MMRDKLLAILTYVLYAVIAVCILDRALATQRTTHRLLAERERLAAQIQELRGTNLRRERIRRALAQDPFYVELVLRRRYGYRRPDEERRTATATARETRPAGRGAFAYARSTGRPGVRH
jgi:hypothetical protein